MRRRTANSLRAAVSSGFRAPTPGQQNAFNVTTAFIDGQLTNNGVVPSTSAVAVARGGGQASSRNNHSTTAQVRSSSRARSLSPPTTSGSTSTIVSPCRRKSI